MMTVEQLRRKLAKMPAKAMVVWRDHDQAEDEYNAPVGYVSVEEALLPIVRSRGNDVECVVVITT